MNYERNKFQNIYNPGSQYCFNQAPPPSYETTLVETNNNNNSNNLTLSQKTSSNEQTREEKYREIIRKHEISNDFSNRLQVLQGFKVVFVFDDSGSMNTALQDSPLNTSDTLFRATRWDELQWFASISIEIATVFDSNGSDVYFLNRKPSPIKNVKNSSELSPYFGQKPNGFTPLAKCLQNVLADNTAITLNEKSLLIIIATDGEPTDSSGKADIPQFKRILQSRSSNVYTTVVVCTDDEESVKYLNKWDRKLPNLDVVDDYRNERNEIRKAKGSSYPFSFGDYVVKSLIGSIDPELDRLDESFCCIF